MLKSVVRSPGFQKRLIVALVLAAMIVVGWPGNAPATAQYIPPLFGSGPSNSSFSGTADTSATAKSTVPPSATPSNTVSPPTVSTTAPATVPASTASPTSAVPPLSVSRSEPFQVVSGQGATLSVFGANFTTSSAIRLVGVGLLATTFVNSTALMGQLPSGLAGGQYTIQVTDPLAGTAQSPNLLLVIGPTSLPPTSTTVPPDTAVPTVMPGQPSLSVRAFSATPGLIGPGGATTLTFEVVNQGNYVAQGGAVSLDSGSKFIPANGQAGVTLPPILPGGSTSVALRVIAAADAPSGPNNIPLSITYADVNGKQYTSKAVLSVTVREFTAMPQVLLTSYTVDPNPAQPGKPIQLHVQLQNLGNVAATQVLVRIVEKDGILLSGNQGDTFPAGTLNPGAKKLLTLPLIVAPSANDNIQTQPLDISYMQNDKVQDTTSTITINISKPIVQEPLMVLASYDAGTDVLKPGDSFQLKVEIRNMGKGVAKNLVIGFSGSDLPGVAVAPQATNDSSNNANRNNISNALPDSLPNETFAPLNTSGTVLLDSLASGATMKLSQQFIVNPRVDSGVYALPIVLRYQLADGSTVQTSLNASLIVVIPPLVQISMEDSLPSQITVGANQALNIKVVNSSKTQVRLTTLDLKADNAQVVAGNESTVGPLDPNANVSIPASIVASAQGPVTVTLTLHYLDDLNRDAAFVKTYTSNAEVPPPPPTPVPVQSAPVSEQVTSEDWVNQLLFGFLGLGS